MIDTWEIFTVYVTKPDGTEEILGEGSYYEREDFLSPVDQLSINKFYILGFGREYLCRVDNFDAETGELWLTEILNLNEHHIELTSTEEPHRFELQVTSLKYEVRKHPDTHSWWGIYCHETKAFFHSKYSHKENAEKAMQRLIDTGSLVCDAILY